MRASWHAPGSAPSCKLAGRAPLSRSFQLALLIVATLAPDALGLGLEEASDGHPVSTTAKPAGSEEVSAALAKAEKQVADLKVQLQAAEQRATEASKDAERLREQLQKDKKDSSSTIFAGLEWLVDSKFQLTIAAVALIVGLSSMWRPVRFLQMLAGTLFAGAAGLSAGKMVEQSVGEIGELEAGLVGAFAGFEAAAMTGLAVAWGFEGFQLLVGAAIGLGMAHASLQLAPESSEMLPEPFFWFSTFALIGFGVIAFGRQAACAVIGPVLGGLMVGNSVAYIAAVFLSRGGDMPAWLDFLGYLLTPNTQTDLLNESELSIVRLTCAVVSVIVAALGLRTSLSSPEVEQVPAPKEKRVTLDLPPQIRMPLLQDEGPRPAYSEPRQYRAGPKRGFSMPQFMRGSYGNSRVEQQPSVPRMPKPPRRLRHSRSGGDDPYDIYA